MPIVEVLCLLLLAPAPQVDEDDGLWREYGFDGLIISKFNDGLAGLRAVDLDGDGRLDLAVVNNNKARIELLVQPGEDAEREPFEPDAINDLPDETHFERDAYPTEEKVSAFAAGDFDGDGRNDLATVGDSGKLTIARRGADGDYHEVARFPLPDRSSSPDALAAGDIDGDGRTDLVALAKQATHLFLQDEDGVLREAPRLPNMTGDPDGFDLIDLDGDGLLDLLYVKADSDWPLRWRLGRGAARFGPELHAALAPIRAHAAGDVDGDGRADVVAIARRSGRLQWLAFARPDTGAALPLSSLRLLPFSAATDGGRREAVLADLTGDGRPELLVAEPGAARVLVHRAGDDAQFASGEAYPSFVGVSHPSVADLDGDGRPELLVSAASEGAVGIAAVGPDGAVAFPRAEAHPGDDLLAVAAADADGDGRSEQWLLVGEGRSRSRTRSLALRSETLAVTVELPDTKTDPTDLLVADLDRSGTPDAIVFVPKERPLVMLLEPGPEGPSFRAVDVENLPGLGILEDVARAAVFHGDVDGDGADELLVPGPNFARAFFLGADDLPEVVGQYNLDDPSARVSAVAAGDLTGDGLPEILLADEGSRRLLVLERRGDDWRESAAVDLGDFEPDGLLCRDLDGDARPDLVLVSDERVGVVRNGAPDPSFVEVADFELPVRDTYLHRVALGDVNGDGAVDLVAAESAEHLIAIAAIDGEEIRHALKFPVFEAHLFEGGGRGGREPRELVVADVTGDGFSDVAILVHDRVIVYPQEPPQ